MSRSLADIEADLDAAFEVFLNSPPYDGNKNVSIVLKEWLDVKGFVSGGDINAIIEEQTSALNAQVKLNVKSLQHLYNVFIEELIQNAINVLGEPAKKIISRIESTDTNIFASELLLMTTGDIDRVGVLPASPIKDDIIEVSKRDAGMGNFIIDGNGFPINGESTMTISKIRTTRVLQFSGIDWVNK